MAEWVCLWCSDSGNDDSAPGVRLASDQAAVWAPPGHQHEVSPGGCHQYSEVGPPIPLPCATSQCLTKHAYALSTLCIIECLHASETYM